MVCPWCSCGFAEEYQILQSLGISWISSLSLIQLLLITNTITWFLYVVKVHCWWIHLLWWFLWKWWWLCMPSVFLSASWWSISLSLLSLSCFIYILFEYLFDFCYPFCPRGYNHSIHISCIHLKADGYFVHSMELDTNMIYLILKMLSYIFCNIHFLLKIMIVIFIFCLFFSAYLLVCTQDLILC